MAKVIEAKAAAVAETLTKSGEAGIDLGIILSIITALLSLFKGCGLSAKQAKARMASPGRLDRLVVRRKVREELKSQGSEHSREAVEAALLDYAAGLSVKDVSAMLKEV
jgi:hypothetical protein